jgi:hypothetical protein
MIERSIIISVFAVKAKSNRFFALAQIILLTATEKCPGNQQALLL